MIERVLNRVAAGFGRKELAALLAAVLAAQVSAALAAEAKQAGLPQFIEANFPLWNANHDGVLRREEIDRLMGNRSIQGREAAVLVTIYRQMKKDDDGGENAQRTKAEVLALAGDRDFQKAVDAATKKLDSLDRRLFAPGDPDLLSFHQGHVGDCFLLAAIAADVHRDPTAVRLMIHTASNGGFKVAFRDGSLINVPALTDAELLLGSKMDGNHGIWLGVLEKAYGIIRERISAEKTGEPVDPKAAPPEEVISGGRPGPIISLLTGHEAKGVRNEHGPHKNGKGMSNEQLHELLMQLTRDRRLMCTAVSRDAKHPPGIAGHHVYAVFGYDAAKREVILFNPWGQTFQPQGEPGPTHGYPVSHGVFNVPLGDFREIFNGIVYETTTPVHSAAVKK